MPELMAWDSVWSPDLIALMVRVAEDIEAVRDERQFNTIAALFQKDGPRKFAEWIAGIRRKVEEGQLAARGVDRAIGKAAEMLAAFGVSES